jgi:hypothetical protein
MAINESKLKTGLLTLGGTAGTPPALPTGGIEFACQATNVRIAPTFNEEGDSVETLCGDTLAPATTTEWALQGTSIQDFTYPDSFIEYTWENNLTQVPFIWKPNATGPTFSGLVQIRALEVGGDVNVRLTTDFDWPIAGQPTVSWATAIATGATAGTPGTWTPSGATPPSSVANLIAGTPGPVTADPATAWTTGQYVQTGTAGVPGQAYWNGTAWTAGVAALDADEEPEEEPDETVSYESAKS